MIWRATHLQVLGVLFLALGASSSLFWALVRRWTTHRRAFAIIEWGKNAGFHVVPAARQHLVAPLETLESHRARIDAQLQSPTISILRLRCDSPVAARRGQQAAEVSWNLLVRKTHADWNPAGLRPTAVRRSILDYFSLSSFSAIGGIERFMLFAIDSTAAREFPDSTARSLLPPDIGLLLHGPWLVLDFSQRAFDDLAFNRMIALSAQLELKLSKRPS